MIKSKTITKKQAAKMLKLYRRMTKAEVKARLGPIGFPECADYSMKKVELEDELRMFLFGHSSLYELGVMWGIVTPIRERRERKKI